MMDSFEYNKVAGAVLGTALLVMAVSIGSEIVFEQHAPAKPGYVIDVPKEGEGGGNQPPPALEPIAVRLAKADAKAGANTAKACLACHTFEKGQPAKIGPNLWNVVGGPDAHMAGFPYSDAMKKRHDAGDKWTFDDLDHFLADPKGFVPGTAMTFAGVKDPQARANVIDYLRTLADSPLPLPPVEAAPAAAGAAPAEPAKPGEPAPAPAGAAPTQPEKPGSPVKPPEPAAPAAPAAPAEPATPAEPAPAAPAAPAAPVEPAQPAQ